MKSIRTYATLVALGVLAGAASDALAQVAPKAQWIWFDDGNPLDMAPAEKVYFRRTFDEPYELAEAKLHITCDNRFTLYVNGREVAQSSRWEDGRVVDLKPHLVRGRNLLAVVGENSNGPAGLVAWLVRLTVPGNHYTVSTDSSWKCSRDAAIGWQTEAFDDSAWKPARELAEFGKAGPWKEITWNGKRDSSRFTVASGFRIEQAADANLTGSIVNLTFDCKGRPMVSRERGPVVILEDKNGDGTYDHAKTLSDRITNCQGLLAYDEQTYYLVGEYCDADLDTIVNLPQSERRGGRRTITGLFRLRDSDGDDAADAIELLHEVRGGIGEHGPHAILAGMDGFLYFCLGNHAWVQAAPAGNSPIPPWSALGQWHTEARTDATTTVAGNSVGIRTLIRSHEADILPRYEDAGGHAVGIRTPGGTVWRLDPDAKQFTLETAGFRNQFDIAFNSLGELFTFDSDMEWDVGLPWYRPVRVNHCVPGAEFGWRSGAAKWPAYFFDSLPATVDIGRGSPCGVVFYNHDLFPKAYRDAFFITDWSFGRIFAVHLERDGATFKGLAEEFVTGKPLNATDIDVAPSGAVYFTTGGRGTEGGLFRIRPDAKPPEPTPPPAEPGPDGAVKGALSQPQPQSAWGRAAIRKFQRAAGAHWEPELAKVIADQSQSATARIRALSYLVQFGPEPSLDLVRRAVQATDAEVRSFATTLLARQSESAVRDDLRRLLADPAAIVQRRALESCLRTGTPTPLERLIPLLAHEDRFVRFTARLCLERLDSLQWQVAVVDNTNPRVATIGMLSLNRLGIVANSEAAALQCFRRQAQLLRTPMQQSDELDVLRCFQLTLLNTPTAPRPAIAQQIVESLIARFPTKDRAVDRELARILAALPHPAGVTKLVAALEACGTTGEDAQADAIHYARCLAAVSDGWSGDARRRYLAWYDTARDWNGGHSYRGYLANFLRDVVGRLDETELLALLRVPENRTRAAAQACERINEKSGDALLLQLIELADSKQSPAIPIPDVLAALGRTGRAEAEAALLRAHAVESQRDVAVRALANFQNTRNWPLFVRALDSKDNTTALAALRALHGIDRKPDGAAAFRAAIAAGLRLGNNGAWDAVVLLRQWSGKHFGARRNEWKKELDEWQKWFATQFPNAESSSLADDAPRFNWTYDQLAAFLDGPGKSGNSDAGRKLFEAAVCAKCHRVGEFGLGVGPDLTTLGSRFKRRDILEAIVYPSRVLTDQYKSVLVATKDGQVLNGMRAPDDADRVVLLLSDATTVKIAKSNIEETSESKQSVMPDGLLNQFTLPQIADLFAFLEAATSQPAK